MNQNYPVPHSLALIPVKHPRWVAAYQKVRKHLPVLLFSIIGLMLVAASTRSKPHNEAVDLIDYSKIHEELAAPVVSEPVTPRPEAKSDIPAIKEMPLSKGSKRNPQKPVNAGELLKIQSLDYIERYHKIAMGEMKQFGIPASITLAQGLIESRAGTSKLAKSNNNHFGMKCFSKNCKKGHCSNYTDDTHKDFFKKFSSPFASFRAHSQLLASGRYAKLKRHGNDYKAWAYGLKSAGYATDRTYAEKLIGIIEKYDLHQYDR